MLAGSVVAEVEFLLATALQRKWAHLPRNLKTGAALHSLMNSGLPLRARYPVAGRVWELCTNSAELIATIRKALPDGVTGSDARLALRLEIAVSDAECCAWERPMCRGRGHLVFTWLGDRSALIYDSFHARVVGEVSRAVAADVRYWRNIVLPFALGVMSPLLGIVPLHAACVIHEGRGVLIGGRSGAGKSTLAATLARRGLTFVSDDWVYLAAGPKPRVHAMPVPLKLLPDSVAWFPELGNLQAATAENGEMSIQVDPAVAFSARRAFCAEPGVVILFDRTTGPLRVRQASVTDLTDWFSESLDCVPVCLSAEREQQLGLIRRLALMPCYIVVTDGTPEQIADDILRVAAGQVVPEPATVGPDSSGITHLDLLRRGRPTPYEAQVRCGGRNAMVATNHPGLLRQFQRKFSNDHDEIWNITVIAEPAPFPEIDFYSWQRDSIAFFSLGRNGAIACDYALHEAAVFVEPSVIDDGSAAAALETLLAGQPFAVAGAGR